MKSDKRIWEIGTRQVAVAIEIGDKLGRSMDRRFGYSISIITTLIGILLIEPCVNMVRAVLNY